MKDWKCIARRFFPGGREEALLDSPDGLLISRSFSTSLPAGTVEAWFSAVSNLDLEGVTVPSCFETDGRDRFRLSLPTGSAELGDRVLPSVEDLAGALGSLHRSGFLHLDLASSPFIKGSDGRIKLVFWGESALLPVQTGSCPEVMAGGFFTQAADYWQFGLHLRSAVDRMECEPSLSVLAEDLCSLSPRKRVAAAWDSGLFPPTEQEPAHLPRIGDRPLTFLESGSWDQRDSVINELLSSSSRKGWPARVVRCSPFEGGRPLPDRPRGGPRVISASDMLSILFPGIAGVNRLLVVDQADFATADLLFMLSELIEIRPPHLRLIVCMSKPVPGLSSSGASIVRLEGNPSLASDVPFDRTGGGWTGPSWYGPRTRVPFLEESSPEELLDPAEIWREGGFRFTADSWKAGLLSEDMRSMAAESFLRTGRALEALEIAGEGAPLLKAEALLAVGRAADAEALLKNSMNDGEPSSKAHLLSDILLDQGRLGEARKCLSGLKDSESIVRMSAVSDMEGNPGEGLELIESALSSIWGHGRSELLCAKSTMQMRLGFYPGASISVDEAVRTARSDADSTGLVLSLQERGRVREVTGRWREALEDYRLASLLASELGMRTTRPVEIDLFILETRMGLLEDARRTRTALRKKLQPESSSLDGLTLDLIESCAAVLTGMGSEALPMAEKGSVKAAELGMPLRQGLCLLYKGQLHHQAGEHEEAGEALRHSKALAGLLGDRHLSLLAGLALAETGHPVEPERLFALATELGLTSEAFEAATISGGRPGRSEALMNLLDLPSPLRACALASKCVSEIHPTALARIRTERYALLESMDSVTRDCFAKMTGALEGGAGPKTSIPDGDAERTMRVFSGWLSSFLAGSGGIDSLAERLGLDGLSDSPEGGVEIERGPPGVYASGPGLEQARLVAPLISVVLGAVHVPAQVREHETNDFPEIHGSSEEIRSLKSAMIRVAHLDLPVLIIGETGTGKELVARGLHRMGNPSGPFIPVDCGAIPENLLESELFGAKRGAYTDNRTDRPGLLACADGGTLFLDEIGNLSPALQVKLLRVLETGAYRQLGSTEETGTRFRLLAATNSDLGSMISEGLFRADLYYRLSVVVLVTPPLRGRTADINSLARLFASQAQSGNEPVVTRAALKKLAAHSWPGNVRELRNVVQRAAVLCLSGTIREEDIAFGPLAAEIRPPAELGTLESAVERHVISVLGACDGSVRRAAEILQCDPKTVRKYGRNYGDRLDRKGLPGR